MGRRRELGTGLGRWILCLVLAVLARPAAAEPVTVFAAASLTDALTEIGRQYRAETGDDLKFSFAAASTLARQIEAGAPAHIFVSADEAWMDYLGERRLIRADTRVSLLGNRLVLISPAGADSGAITLGRETTVAALLGVDGRLAIADPDHTPIGRYAREAFVALGLWGALEPRLARTDTVRAALALVERGEAPFGIVYATDARLSDRVVVRATIGTDLHTPITYPFAVVAGAEGPDVERAFAYLTSEAGLATFVRFGFTRR